MQHLAGLVAGIVVAAVAAVAIVAGIIWWSVCRKKPAKPGYPSAPSARKSDEILPTAAELPEPGHARVEGEGDGSPDMEATKGDFAVPKLRQMRV